MPSLQPIIVGIDPGTTAGLCILDTEGKIIRLISEKDRGLNSVVSEITHMGIPIAIGTDKKIIPEFVEKAATKLGARLFHPHEDLKVMEKRGLVGYDSFGNDHKRDAFASALVAYRSLRPLLKKIKSFCERYDRQPLMNELICTVVRKKISIVEALSLIERVEENREKDIHQQVHKRILKEKDFFDLLDKLKRLRKENDILRARNASLRGDVHRMKQPVIRQPQKIHPLLEHKEQRIRHYDSQCKAKEEEIRALEREMQEIIELIGKIQDHHVVKRLKNLGMREFEHKKAYVNIQKEDIIYVEDVTISSERIIQFLQERVLYIMYDGILPHHMKNLPFVFIDSNTIDMKKGTYFCTVSKESFAKIRSSREVFEKIIEDYKRQRGF